MALWLSSDIHNVEKCEDICFFEELSNGLPVFLFDERRECGRQLFSIVAPPFLFEEIYQLGQWIGLTMSRNM